MIERPTAAAHRVVREVVKEGETVVDATIGNGHDTLFLAKLVGSTGAVVGFDVQEAAIEATRRRIEEAKLGARVTLYKESHVCLGDRVDEVSAVMFNLGYLPGSDHSVFTGADESLKAIQAAVESLRPGGVVTVVCYPGHAGGDLEAAAVVDWARSWDGASVGEQAREASPFLVVVRA